ncbi:MAG: protein-L-isoaspartate(D-aspartate) O-methyltransferase [Pseudomonadota bacterium]
MSGGAPDTTADPFRPARLLLELRRHGVTDDSVLQAIEAVDRADFAAPGLEDLAYEECDLPIGCGQTLYSPLVAGQLLQALQIAPGAGEAVFLVGAGSGYTMALAARTAGVVAGIDRYFTLVEAASQALADHDQGAAFRFYHGDGLGGLDTGETFDRILLTGTVDAVPSALTRTLSPHGRMVVPVRDGDRWIVRVLNGDGRHFDRALARPISALAPGPAQRL